MNINNRREEKAQEIPKLTTLLTKGMTAAKTTSYCSSSSSSLFPPPCSLPPVVAEWIRRKQATDSSNSAAAVAAISPISHSLSYRKRQVVESNSGLLLGQGGASLPRRIPTSLLEWQLEKGPHFSVAGITGLSDPLKRKRPEVEDEEKEEEIEVVEVEEVGHCQKFGPNLREAMKQTRKNRLKPPQKYHRYSREDQEIIQRYHHHRIPAVNTATVAGNSKKTMLNAFLTFIHSCTPH